MQQKKTITWTFQKKKNVSAIFCSSNIFIFTSSGWEYIYIYMLFLFLQEPGGVHFAQHDHTQRSNPGSRQNECPFELFLVRLTWYTCLQLGVKVRLCRINMYPCKSKCIFLLAIFQKEERFKITCILVSGTTHFSVCTLPTSLYIWCT